MGFEKVYWDKHNGDVTISREDISPLGLIKYEKPRFGPLSVVKMLDIAGIVPNQPQIGILNAIQSEKYRFITAAVSRRVGKTFISNLAALLASLLPNSNVAIVAPNYALASISFQLQRRFLKNFSVETVVENTKDRVIELTNGSTIRMGSSSQVDALVGRSYDLILYDEAAIEADGESGFNVQLRPTMDRPGAKAIFISTPRGNNWFKKFYERGFSSDTPEWISIHATYKSNPRAILSEIEAARAEMSKAEFEQEYLASFSVFEGQIFSDFSKDSQVLFELPSDLDIRNCDVIMGLDLGFKDATAAIVVMYHHGDSTYYIVDEYVDSEKNTAEHATALVALRDKWNVDIIYADSAAAQSRYDLASIYGLATSKSKKAKLEGIGFLQSIIRRVYVVGDLPHTMSMLDQYRWENRPGALKEAPVHDKHSHIADAFRYAVYSYNTSTGSF